MEVPDKIRYLIEALRGGGASTFQKGKLVDQQYGPSGNIKAKSMAEQLRAMMPTHMREYQLHNQEPDAEQQTYAEFKRNQ